MVNCNQANREDLAKSDIDMIDDCFYMDSVAMVEGEDERNLRS